jgi:GGDEF domain-containing protein
MRLPRIKSCLRQLPHGCGQAILGDFRRIPGSSTLRPRVSLFDSGLEAKVKINLGASVGMAQWQPGETAVQITERADASMYQEKELSRTR